LGNWATIGINHATVSAGQIVPYTGYTEIGNNPAGIPNSPGANIRWTQTTEPTTVAINGAIDINTLTFTNNTKLWLNFDAGTVLRFGPTGGIFRPSSSGGSGVLIGL